jgi:hypothetical protein
MTFARFKRNPPRIVITCVICGWTGARPANEVRPPRSQVALCGAGACHVVWKMAIANAFRLDEAAA